MPTPGEIIVWSAALLLVGFLVLLMRIEVEKYLVKDTRADGENGAREGSGGADFEQPGCAAAPEPHSWR